MKNGLKIMDAHSKNVLTWHRLSMLIIAAPTFMLASTSDVSVCDCATPTRHSTSLDLFPKLRLSDYDNAGGKAWFSLVKKPSKLSSRTRQATLSLEKREQSPFKEDTGYLICAFEVFLCFG